MTQPIKPNSKNVLGRGLNALLEDADVQKVQTSSNSNFQIIPIEFIVVNPFQPRQDFSQDSLNELSESIKTHGIIQPLTVRKLKNGNYQLIAGERRLRAAKLAGLQKIPAYIRHTEDRHMLEIALIENIQRESLNAIEIAISYQRLLTECNLTQESLADRIGKDRTTVNNYLRLLKLPADIQVALRDQKISMGHARALINLDSKEKQLNLLNKIIKNTLSVRQVEQLVKNLSIQTTKTLQNKQLNADFKKKLKTITQQLNKKLRTKVYITTNMYNQGEIKILFNSEKELNKILTLFK